MGQKQEDNAEEEEEDQKEDVNDIKSLLECAYNGLCSNNDAMNDFVTSICSKWPLDASYPIHFGAMLRMIIEDKSKSQFYSFIVDNKDYNILQNALNQYSGSDIQANIKQMANLCNTVGIEKFATLSANILKSFKNALEGQAFLLDFAPLLQQQQQNDNDKEEQESAETGEIPKANKEIKKMKAKAK